MPLEDRIADSRAERWQSEMRRQWPGQPLVTGRGASVPRLRAYASGPMIPSGVGPKQHLALRIKAAFSRYEARVTQASIVEPAVPSASLPPFAPGDVIAILAVGISRFPGRTKEALGGVAWTGDYVSGHRGSCQHGKKDGGGADQFEFRHAFLPLVLLTVDHQVLVRIPPLVPKR